MSLGIQVKIKVFENDGSYLKTIFRCLRPGGTDRAWYILYNKERLKVHGDCMDCKFKVNKIRYVVLGGE
jgi:hypothetical protein